MSTMGKEKCKCPLCKENFEYLVQYSYTTFGQNLDFKPYGAARIPTPVPKCPKCNFVFFEDTFTKDEINNIKKKLEENNIFAIEPDMPNYYYLAKEIEMLNKPLDAVIYYYLSAVWENDKEQSFGKLSNIVIENINKTDKDNENYYVYQLIKVDLLRRASNFDDSMKLIEVLKNDNNYPEKFSEILKYQMELIKVKDTQEHPQSQ